jgi:phosphate transport system substrate-binding protein
MINAPRICAGLMLNVALLVSASVCTAAQASAPPNSGISIWTGKVTSFRKEHGSLGRYKRKWNLSALPHYVPGKQLTGTLRIWGLSYLQDGPLGKRWADAFRRYQPGIRIEYHLPTGAVAVSALATGVADIGVTYRVSLTDSLNFEQVFHRQPTVVTVATGSLNVYGWSPAGMIVVNAANPLTRMSIKQLDGVFGSARYGGYKNSVWHTRYPYSRGAEDNIRVWGQLGLKGKWAHKRIQVCGQNLRAGAMREFSDQVLAGSMQYVGGLRTFTNYLTTGGQLYTWSEQVRRYILHHPYAICYASPLTLAPGMTVLALQPRTGGAYVSRTLEAVHDNTYPLTHHVHFVFDRVPGKPVDPRISEFLHFVLSQEGQALVESDGRFLPLTAPMVRAQLKKLN